MINSIYVNAETGEVLDYVEALLVFANGGAIDWYLDGEKMGAWNEDERESAKKLFEIFSENA